MSWVMGFLEPMLLSCLLSFPIVFLKTPLLSGFLSSFSSYTFYSVAYSSWIPQPAPTGLRILVLPGSSMSEWAAVAAGATLCLWAWNAFSVCLGAGGGRSEAPRLHTHV